MLERKFWENFNLPRKAINLTMFNKILEAAWYAKLDMNFDSEPPDAEELIELRNCSYKEAVLTKLSKLDSEYPCYYNFLHELKSRI